MSIKVTRTATIVFDVEDAANGERFTIYHCDECKALILSEEAREHLQWHGTLLHAPTTAPRPD